MTNKNWLDAKIVLPKEEEIVLIYTYRCNHFGRQTDRRIIKLGYFSSYDSTEWRKDDGYTRNVTHWMPLPNEPGEYNE